MAQETLLGFPAHTLYPQGVCSIRKAAKPLTAALPYRRGEFTTLSTASFLFIQPLFYTKSSPTARGPSVSCKLFRFLTIFVEHLRPLCYTGNCNIVYCVPAQDIHKKGGCANGKPCCHHHLRRGIHLGSGRNLRLHAEGRKLCQRQNDRGHERCQGGPHRRRRAHCRQPDG